MSVVKKKNSLNDTSLNVSGIYLYTDKYLSLHARTLILEKTTSLKDVPFLISTNTNAIKPNARSPQHIISSSISIYFKRRLPFYFF